MKEAVKESPESCYKPESRGPITRVRGISQQHGLLHYYLRLNAAPAEEYSDLVSFPLSVSVSLPTIK
jgi:hypothetical protein